MNTTNNIRFSIRICRVIGYNPANGIVNLFDLTDGITISANANYSLIPRAPRIGDDCLVIGRGLDNFILAVVPQDKKERISQLLPPGGTSIVFNNDNYINFFDTIFEIIYSNVNFSINNEGGLAFLQGNLIKLTTPIGHIELNNEEKSITITFITNTILEKYKLIFSNNGIELRYGAPDDLPIIVNSIVIKRTGIELSAGISSSPIKAGIKINTPTQTVTISGSFLNIATGGVSLSLPFSPQLLMGEEGVDIKSDNKLVLRIGPNCPPTPVPCEGEDCEEINKISPCFGGPNESEIILDGNNIIIRSQNNSLIEIKPDGSIIVKSNKIILQTPNPIQVDSGKIVSSNGISGIDISNFTNIKDLKAILAQIISYLNTHIHSEPDGTTGPPTTSLIIPL